MTRVCFAASFMVSLTIFPTIDAVFQDFMNLQHPRSHLPDTKFNYGEYSEHLETEERRENGPETAWDRIPQHNDQPSRYSHTQTESPDQLSDTFDPNITWDPHWITDMSKMGQLTAVDLDPEGRIAIFSRRERIWGLTTFDYHNKFDCSNGPIKHDTILLYDKTGRKVLQWGRNMFYLPHGLTIDHEGNYWMTDVALHQVFKFDAKDIEKNWNLLKKAENQTIKDLENVHDYKHRFEHSIIKPSIILGQAFEPGDDNLRFCKPTAVAVAQNGDFFVSDGYCNSRVIKFNKNGERILHWGRSWPATDTFNKSPPSYALFVPHSLALAEDQNLIYVADREDGRVMAYNAQNGTFHREFKHPSLGTKIYAVAYAREKLYLINGPEPFKSHYFHVRGFVLDTNSGNVVSQFGPGRDMLAPHDIAVSDDGSEIYTIELDDHKVYRFVQDVSKQVLVKTNLTSAGNATYLQHHEVAPLTDDTPSDVNSRKSGSGAVVLSIITSAITLIGLCLAVAAVVARCQKRGCLLSVRKRAYWEAERRENFKLSSLLETKPGKGFKSLEKRPNTRDFSKLSTEPETSEDERVEDSLVI
ncbi:peptidyl-alpha-hydroxyglycine alpha-amidating lyase 1-like [Venturia canescens]|uniref:peptidyl-alpha-hydroxyglycine alpha-amidating lyase 1-like n=1 Tax=Venturia canescens TaxID=32260 RepID=UPI001C9C4EDF|nr:peptidyl-alpha-hydroxyglycine alpha-amidating lyase 1-like [Venturia canescens]